MILISTVLISDLLQFPTRALQLFYFILFNVVYFTV